MFRLSRCFVVLMAGATLTGCAHGLRTSEKPVDPASAYAVGAAAAASASTAAPVANAAPNAVSNAAAAPATLNNEGPVTSNDLTDTGTDMAKIPHEVNRLVLQWVDYFQGRGREHMERYLSRSSKYLPMMKEILRKEGLPEDLVYIALIESGFSAHAHSSANAVGFWQFIRPTGRRYGLRVDNYIDERRDFEKATYAAADYFKGLYNLFGSWYLAIASYNVGEGKIMRLVMKHHTRDFWQLAKDRKLPQETVNYVPKFLAARIIAKEPEKFGFTEIDYMEPLNYEPIEIAHSVDLRKMAQSLAMDYEDLHALNPGFKRGIALEAGGKLVLRVPKGTSEKAQLAAASALVIPGRALAASVSSGEEDYTYYRIRRGDTVSSIARRFHTSHKAIRSLNKLSAVTRLVAGRRIKVPGESVAGLSKREINSVSPAATLARAERASRGRTTDVLRADANRTVHIVRRGDTLFDIARQYKVSLQRLASHNRIARRSRIAVGTKLEIP